MGVQPRHIGGICVAGAALLAGACSFTTQTAKTHAPFVPVAHRQASAGVLPDPPQVAQPEAVVAISSVLRDTFEIPEERLNAQMLVQQAYLHLQHGKMLYQASEMAAARKEFDTAVDLMFAASSQDPGDRQEFGRELDEMVDNIHRFDLAGLGAAAGSEGQFQQAPLEDILKMTFPVDPRLKVKVREQVAATASQLPLTVNDTVLAYITYFSGRGHRTMVDAMQRSGRYRPMITRILDEEGLPQELIHLAQAESGFYPRAVSRMAADGMWQFVKFRGNEYGLKQTPYTDDRMDPEKATRAAAHHLHDLYSEFGDWYLALAAYNCGPNAVEDAVARTGYADFWELRSRGVLPAETTNYVPIILAMTIMEKNAAEYGLDGIQLDPPLEYDTVETTAKTSMALVSDITDTSLPELAELNPAVLKNIVPADYALHVPKGTGNEVMAGLEMVPADHRDSWRVHRLGIGETVADVSKRFGIPITSLVAANNLQSREASEGDRLVIPVVARPAPVAARRPVRSAAVAHRTASVSSKTKAPVAKPAARPKPKARKSPVMTATSKPRTSN
ncbi:MAG TPA: transglycosylase SLT domain-containing protein [Bryobacteraceae bacterium]|nr:transglycosylase SLT domain-containing protein [Bryobacteraceae bacterium]